MTFEELVKLARRMKIDGVDQDRVAIMVTEDEWNAVHRAGAYVRVHLHDDLSDWEQPPAKQTLLGYPLWKILP